MEEFNLTEKILYPNKTKGILFLFLVLIFFVIGVFMIMDGAKMGWFVSIVFGLGVIIFLINLMPQASYLSLDKNGFETCSMFRKHNYSWKDVSNFGVGSISNNKMVMFNFSKDYKKQEKARNIASAISGAEGALHDNFGLKANELAALMNAYKMQFEQIHSNNQSANEIEKQ